MSTSASKLISLLAGVALLISTDARGQPCTPRWMPGDGMPGANGVVSALFNFDPDGAGPVTGRLIAGGSFTVAGDAVVKNVAQWNGQTWLPLGDGIQGSVTSLVAFDADGNGPEPLQLIAAAVWAGSGFVFRWNGASWAQMGGRVGDWTTQLAVVDADGEGPQLPQLYVAAQSTNYPGPQVGRVFRWEGQDWSPLGASIGNAIYAVGAFDPDGPGPAETQVVAGGSGMVFRWNADVWVPVGGSIGIARDLKQFDLDGLGPAPERLVIGGQVGVGPTGSTVAYFDGSSWHALGSGPIGEVHALLSLDRDGAGPEQPNLIAAGVFSTAGGLPARSVARWDGSSWHSLGDTEADAGRTVHALAAFDADGLGPAITDLIMGGQFYPTETFPGVNVAKWDGSHWWATSGGMGGGIASVATFDDGAGPHIVAGGGLTVAGGQTVSRVAKWSENGWEPMGQIDNGYVSAVEVFDADGTGPQAARVFVGGTFTSCAGVVTNRIAQWDGASWVPVGTGTNGAIKGMAVFDVDGPGPETANLIVVGAFTSAGGQASAGGARWDGSQWHPMPTPAVSLLRVIDLDGEGPLPPALLAARVWLDWGYVYQWQGSGWTQLGQELGVSEWDQCMINAFAAFDPDGSGPAPPQLVVGGHFYVGNSPGLAKWAGQWEPFDPNLNGTVTSLATFDPDGPGPAQARLVVGGNFSTGGQWRRIAMFDGNTWSSLGSDMDAGPTTLALFDPDGAAPRPAQLVAAGSFTRAGEYVSVSFARFGCATLPCYANCDGSTLPPVLNAADFYCFLDKYVANDPYANCDGVGGLTGNDFQCFINAYVAGCP